MIKTLNSFNLKGLEDKDKTIDSVVYIFRSHILCWVFIRGEVLLDNNHTSFTRLYSISFYINFRLINHFILHLKMTH